MKTTSHFIGISLNPSILANLFISLQDYIDAHNLQKVVILQNPLSPHITLYYLGKYLSYEMKRNIQDTLCDIRLTDAILAGGIGYFGGVNNRHTLFIHPETSLPLKQYRDTFELLFQANDIYENMLEFVPHITLAKILDRNIFEEYRTKIEICIKNELQNIQKSNISLGNIQLYAVNSNFVPQLQVTL